MTAKTYAESGFPGGLLIGGSWVQDTSMGVMEHVNPSTGRVQTTFPVAGPAEVDAAVNAARDAFPAWRAVSPLDRRNIMFRIADGMRARAAEFAEWSTLENGTPTTMAKVLPGAAARWFEYYGEWIDKLDGSTIPAARSFDYSLLEPYGVVAIILTWNGPVGALGLKVAAALAAGCCVVLKPPELAPFTATIFGRTCADAGLPPGVLNMVVGGPDTGAALVTHPGIDKVSFTGGPAAAAKVQAACGQNFTPVVLELGGKSANVIFDDSKLDQAALVSAMGVVGLSGQVCCAPTRALVQDSVYDEVMGRILETLRGVTIGDPRDPATKMGPIISGASRDRMIATVERACDNDAAKLMTGGQDLDLPSEIADGFFVPPIVLGDVDNSSEVAQTELFGPVLSVIRFSSDDEAIALANDSKFGLAAYAYTSNLSRAHRLASELDAGTVCINGGNVLSPVAPFGGFKRSGYGKEGGREGIQEYLRIKHVSIGLS